MKNKALASSEERFFTVSALLTITLMAAAIIMAITGSANSALQNLLYPLSLGCAAASVVIGIIALLAFGIVNHYYKSIRYGNAYARMRYGIRHALAEAGYCETDSLGNIRIPKTKTEFSDDLKSGKLMIRNSIHFDKPLEKENISSGLGPYVIERFYLSDDQNWYVYEFYDHRTMQQLQLNTYEDFHKLASQEGPYSVFIDNRSSAKLQHMLIVGATRSGKTYMLYSLILQMVLKKPFYGLRYHLYFADPKQSSLWIAGNRMDLKYNASSTEDIINALTAFRDAMMKRSEEMIPLLRNTIDGDYRSFNLEPHIFIFDEFAAFMGSLQTLPKAGRDKVMSLLKDIVLMGAQLGFFMVVVMQKSDSTSLPTMIRDSLTFKIVLGNAEDTTYTTALGPSPVIPIHDYKTGQGVFTNAGYVNTPKIAMLPTWNFDIVSAFARTLNEAGAL